MNSAAVLRYGDLLPEIKEKLCLLFRNGHNAASALKSHKIDLMLEFGDKYYEIAANARYLPSLSVVDKLFHNEFKVEYGNISGEDMLQGVERLLKEYVETKNAKAVFRHSSDGKHYFIVICTPIMLRAHEKISQSGELVMVDASGGVDKQRHRVYFLVTPCMAGGLPLATIISDTEKEYVFSESLSCLKDLLGESAFYFAKEPKGFITDNDLKELTALQENFSTSIKLLCQFHMLKSIWSWGAMLVRLLVVHPG